MRVVIRYLRNGVVQEDSRECRADLLEREGENRPQPVLCSDVHRVEDFTDQCPVG